jgi:biopolymer transport protein ExbD
MQAMDVLRNAGIEDIGLITEPKLRTGESPSGGK